MEINNNNLYNLKRLFNDANVDEKQEFITWFLDSGDNETMDFIIKLAMQKMEFSDTIPKYLKNMIRNFIEVM